MLPITLFPMVGKIGFAPIKRLSIRFTVCSLFSIGYLPWHAGIDLHDFLKFWRFLFYYINYQRISTDTNIAVADSNF